MPTNPRLIADELADALEDVVWTGTQFAAQRRNWASVEIEQMANPVVLVVPGGVDLSRIGRLDWQSDNSVTVFVGRHVNTDAEVDEMYDLTEVLTTYIRSKDLGGGLTSPQSVSVDINPEDAMNDRNVWRAVITATYRTLATDTLPSE